MKKGLCLGLAVVLCAGALCGCDSKTAYTKNTVQLQKNGKLVEVAIEDFNESYYSVEELQSYIDEAVNTYAETAEKGAVKAGDLKVGEDNKANLTLTFKTASDYASFYNVDCYAGTVLDAQSAGFSFDADFLSVDDNTVVPKYTVMAEDEAKVLIIETLEDIVVPGPIAYVSTNFTKVESPNTVSINVTEGNDVPLVYVVYRKK